jgi:hypothetical protein
MTERHYGNDVPTGPIPVIPPQDHPDVPESGRTPSIPTQRDSSASERPAEARPDRAPRRLPWMWVLLALLAVLCVAAALMLGLVDTAHAGALSSVPVSVAVH